MPTESPTSPEQNPRCERSWLRRIFCLGRLNDAVHQAWGVILIAAAILFYVWGVGLPAGCILARIRAEPPPGLGLEAGRVRFSPVEGLLIDDIVLRETNTEAALVKVGTAALELSFAGLAEGRKPSLVSLEARNSTLSWPIGSSADGLKRVDVSNIEATVIFDADAIRIASLRGSLFDLPFRASGRVNRGPPTGASPWEDLIQALEVSRRLPPWVSRFASGAADARFSTPPAASFMFCLDSRSGQVSRARLDAGGLGTSIRGGVLDSWNAGIDFVGRRVDLRELKLSARRGEMRASGWLDMAEGAAAFDLESSLPAGQAGRWLPGPIQSVLTSMNLRVTGGLQLSIAGGPAPALTIADHIRGSVEVSRAYVKDLWVEQGSAAFRTTSAGCDVTNITLSLGSKDRLGSFTGDVSYAKSSQEWSGHLGLEINPGDAVSIMNEHQARFVDRFTFPGPMPRFGGTFRAGPGFAGFEGLLKGSNFTYNGVALGSLDTTLRLEGSVLHLAPWRVERDDGFVSGTMAYNFRDLTMDVDLQSTANAHAVVDLVGPALKKGMSWATFQGPTVIRAAGVVDCGAGTNTDLEVSVEGGPAALFNHDIDRATVQVRALGHRYEATNVDVSVHGGTIRGTVDVYPDEVLGHSRYTAKMKWDELNAALALNSVRTNVPTSANLGTLSGRVRVDGVAAEGYENELRAEGTVKIRDGELFRIPVLGGLSKYLGAIIPGVGFASQNNLDLPFVIENGYVSSDSIMLEGAALSIRGRGKVSIQGNLSLDWQVQPLRKGGVAQVVRFVTSPVTKLFEFHLGGTVNEPKWTPSNLPKEMFLIFD